MNAFNRLVMLIIALLLIAVPVLLLLVSFGVLLADQVAAVTGYRVALDALDTLSAFSFDPGARFITGLVGILVALVAGYLAFKEIPLGRQIDRKAYIKETPGQEIAITAQAVRRLAEGAAQEVGAAAPKCYLASEKRRYDVSCNIRVPRSEDFADLAARTQGNIRRVLEEQQVPVNDVEVTVQGTTTSQQE